jgi:TetR/AcrR family transcriptional regulator
MGIQERKGREREARKEEIIIAAERVFFEKGVSVATMDDVAAEAELSKGTLYLYYRSKEDLFVAVAYRGIEIMYRLFLEATSTEESPVKRIANLGEAYRRFFLEHRNYFRMMYFFESSQFHANVSPEALEQCLVNDRKMWDIVFGIIRKAIDSGMFHADLNPVEVGIMFWSNSNGFFRLIDRQDGVWTEEFGLDFDLTLRRSNMLLLEAMLTKEGKRQNPWVLEFLHGSSKSALDDHM